jgi:hypothetical protein
MLRKLISIMALVAFAASGAMAITYEEVLLDDMLKTNSGIHVDNSAEVPHALHVTYSGGQTQGIINEEQDLFQVIGASTNDFDLSAAAYDTIGELVAGIDALTYWSCDIDDSDLRSSDDSGYCYNVSSVAIGTDDLYEVKIDTNGATATDTYVISKRIDVSDATDDQIAILEVRGLPATATDDFEIYEETSLGVSTKIWDSNIGSNSAEQSVDFTTDGGLGGLEASRSNDVIIKMNGTAAQATDGTDYLQILFKK